MRKINIRPFVPNSEQHGGRVLIPRQQRPPLPYDSAKGKRTAKACTNCRKRKTKCTGGTPACLECQTNNRTCTYENGRRDRVMDLTCHKDILLALVKDLAATAGDADRARIKDVLQEIHEDSDRSPSEAHAYMEDAGEPSLATYGESSGPASTAYATSDRGAEPGRNTNENNYPDIAQFGEPDSHASAARHHVAGSPFDKSVSGSTLWLGDGNVQVDQLAHPYDLPSYDEATELLRLYLTTVHDWLPILPVSFEDQMRRYYAHPVQVTSKWRAILNLVFAIAARYRSMTRVNEGFEGNRGNEDVTYMSRAIQLLAVESNAMLTQKPDIPLIQALGLLTLYYLSAGHVHQAWSTVNIAIRLSIVLNLHLKDDDSEVWHTRVDAKSLAWWNLRSLDTLLSSLTGRPSAISVEDCNLSLPGSFSQDETRQRATKFLQINLKITVIAHCALSSLYSVSAADLSQRSLTDRITKLITELETLLPAILDRERLILHFNWLYTMILVTRPYLRHIMIRIDDEPESSPDARELAKQCLRAAQGTVRLFPEQPNDNIFRNGPWWCITPYIMHTMSVLLSVPPTLNSESSAASPSIPQSIDKLVRWLQWMKPRDPMAARALAAVLDSRRRAGDDSFADLFPQDSPDMYNEYALPPWDLSMSTGMAAEPVHFMDDAVELEDLVASVEPQSQPQPGVLPLPPRYNNAFAGSQNIWNW